MPVLLLSTPAFARIRARGDNPGVTPHEEGEATRLLLRLQAGDPGAGEALFDLVQAELRRLAGRYMRDQPAEHTLQPTALVNEAWLRLCGPDEVRFESRGHFLAVAARAMRSILVDHARARETQKRGEGHRPQPIDELLARVEERAHDLLALDAALERLERHDADLARIVVLRFFGGMTVDEVGEHLGVSGRTVDRGWRTARAWLKREAEAAS